MALCLHRLVVMLQTGVSKNLSRQGITPLPRQWRGAGRDVYVGRSEGMSNNDSQFIFSRVQHHFHKKTKNGYVPLPRTCVSKTSAGKCKHDFPMKRQLNSKMRVVCRGNASRFGVRAKGKRNKLGLPLNRRSAIDCSSYSSFSDVSSNNSRYK